MSQYILVGIDGSAISESLVNYAIWLAKSNGLTIKLLHTIEHSHQSEQAHHEGNLTPNIRRELLKELSEEERAESKELIAEGKKLIAAAKSQVEAAGITHVIAKLRHGTLPEAIEDLQSEIALVMLGSKGLDHAGEDKGLGYHLEESIRSTNTPVFIAQKTYSEPKKIMFAYNGSPTSKKALAMINQHSLYKDPLETHVVCIHSDIKQAEQLVTEAKDLLSLSSAGEVVTQALSRDKGDAIEQLIDYQEDNNIDLIAMGAFSHGKVHGFFFGSFTTKMIQQSDCNFLLIR